jgi:hypothetical protein
MSQSSQDRRRKIRTRTVGTVDVSSYWYPCLAEAIVRLIGQISRFSPIKRLYRSFQVKITSHELQNTVVCVVLCCEGLGIGKKFAQNHGIPNVYFPTAIEAGCPRMPKSRVLARICSTKD